jgi:acetoin utilization deacetylase AcuC-like enzyme
MTTAYAFVPSRGHRYQDHPESPARFDLLQPVFERCGATRLETASATKEEIVWVHRPEMIASLERACRQGDAIIDSAPTFVTRTSFEDALCAAGAALACTRAVLTGAAENAFAVVRPPGHHAEPDQSMGFCLFNNAAIAAREALGNGVRRLAVVDYDAHHGNGTQAAFLDEHQVAYLSTHQWGIYPGTGWIDEAPHAKKRIVNVPLPAGSGDQAYAQIADEIIEPFITEFEPGLILVSAGFDAHWKDPITTLGLSSAGFHRLSQKLVHLARVACEGKIVFVLEGGYDPLNMANGVDAVFAALTGQSFEAVADENPRREPDIGQRLHDITAWHGYGL